MDSQWKPTGQRLQAGEDNMLSPGALSVNSVPVEPKTKTLMLVGQEQGGLCPIIWGFRLAFEM